MSEKNAQTQVISRRNFLERGARTTAAVTIASLLRGSFLGSSQSKETPNSEGELQDSVKIEQREVVPTPEEIKERLLQNIIEKIVMVDIGTTSNSGEIGVFSEYEVWQALTRNFDATIEDYHNELYKPSLEKNIVDRLALDFSWLGFHGRDVESAFSQGAQAAYDTESLPNIQFQTVADSPFQLSEMISFSKHGEYYSKNQDRRGSAIAVDIQMPKLDLEANAVVSMSLQFGKTIANYYEEERIVQNTIITSRELRNIIKKEANYRGGFRYSESMDFSYIFPSGAELRDIAEIELIGKDDVGNVVSSELFNLENAEIPDFYDSSSQHIDENALIDEYKITLKSGQVILPNKEIEEGNLDYAWEPREYLANRSAESIYGAYSPDNPFRQENLELLAAFLKSNPDNFFVLALGNHGDEITDADLAVLPDNVVFVGQTKMTGEITNDVSVQWLGSSEGNTKGNSETIFVTTSKFNVHGSGSSLATPLVALAASQYSTDNSGELPTRPEFIKSLRDARTIVPFQLTGLPTGDNVVGEQWSSYELDSIAMSGWTNNMVDRIHTSLLQKEKQLNK